MYYIGIIATVLVIPWWSDRIGRKWITISSYLIFLLAIIGILVSTELIWLYVLVFITGTTFPGRAIVALSWLLEYQKNSRKQRTLFLKLLSYPVLVIIFTLCFQFGTRNYRYIVLISSLCMLIGTSYQVFFVPESANYLYE